MDIAGHVSPQMLKRYSHIRMQAKRNALEAIARNTSPPVEAKPEEPAALDKEPPRRIK